MGAGGIALLTEREDIEVCRFPPQISPADFNILLRSRPEVCGVILGLTAFGRVECASAPGVQVVSRTGVGYDTIDLQILTQRRVPVFTVGTANASAVAEQALHFMIALAKRGAELHAMVQSGRWQERLSAIPVDLAGKIALIIGYGRIGSRVARRCLAMEMHVHVYDPYVLIERILADGCSAVADLGIGLQQADFVTVHCPKSPETIGMLDASRLKLMKSSAILINTARGGIVSETALYAALTNGTIWGAGLDVFDNEPPDIDNPLLKLRNVITSPHMAGMTSESIERMATRAAQNVLDMLDGHPCFEHLVNPNALRPPTATSILSKADRSP